MTGPSRRQFLKAGVATASLVGLSGCLLPPPPSATGGGSFDPGALPEAGNFPTSLDPAAFGDQFSEVVDAVDLGADPSGEEPIGGVLNSALSSGSDTLLYLPEGVYKMNSGFRLTGRSHNVGVVGDGAVIRHGTVEAIGENGVTAGEFSGDPRLFYIGSPSSPHSGNVVFGGITFDQRPENTGMRGLNLYTTGQATVRNVTFAGTNDLGGPGPFRVVTLADDASITMQNIDMSGGAKHYVNTINSRSNNQYGSGRPGASWGTTGVAIGPEQRGTILLENVICGPFPDNGLYLKGGLPENSVGRKILRNCVAQNSNVANIRVNSSNDWVRIPEIDGRLGDGYDRSVVENCRIILNDTPDPRAWGAQHGIRLDDGDPVVRNCQIQLAHENGHGIRVQSGTNGAGVLNTSIDVHAPQRALNVAGSNATLQGNTVNLHDSISRSRVLSGISEGAGVAIRDAAEGAT